MTTANNVHRWGTSTEYWGSIDPYTKPKQPMSYAAMQLLPYTLEAPENELAPVYLGTEDHAKVMALAKTPGYGDFQQLISTTPDSFFQAFTTMELLALRQTVGAVHISNGHGPHAFLLLLPFPKFKEQDDSKIVLCYGGQRLVEWLAFARLYHTKYMEGQRLR